MKILTRIIIISFLVVIFVFCLYCGASHNIHRNIIYKESDFCISKLQNNGLIVGGICSYTCDLTREERIKDGSSIFNILLEKLKDAHTIQMMNVLQLIDNIGKEKYFSMMEAYDKRRMFDATSMQSIKDSVDQMQYFLVAYIENENIIDESYDEYIEDEQGDERIETEYEKTYILTVEFQIFDLSRKEMVWRSQLYNRAVNCESRTTRSGCVDGCMDNIIQTILFGEPAEINKEEVLAKIIEAFAKELDETKST